MEITVSIKHPSASIHKHTHTQFLKLPVAVKQNSAYLCRCSLHLLIQGNTAYCLLSLNFSFAYCFYIFIADKKETQFFSCFVQLKNILFNLLCVLDNFMGQCLCKTVVCHKRLFTKVLYTLNNPMSAFQ